jgi:flagellar basal-body rod modification protein FlgD
MSAITPTSAAAATTYTDDTTNRVVKKTLGQEDFIKLLTTQMSNQDPMNPTSDTDQIAQLAQFSSLQSMNSLLTNSQLASASSMIGKNVTAMSSDGTTSSGTVDSVQLNSGSVYVTINGQQYDYSSISQVKAATVPVTTTPATS